MTERDIIITAFCCGGKVSCKKEANKFKEPPIVIKISGGSVEGFSKTINSYREKNSILNSLLAEKLPKNTTPRRIALMSFSHGWVVPTQILRSSKDIDKIDCVIVLDGIHTSSLAAWKKYSANSKLWLAHTQCMPSNGPSAKSTNTKIINSIRDKTKITIPDYISNVKLDKPINVFSKLSKPHNKIYIEDPLLHIDIAGHSMRCEYDGNTPQDQTYLSQYVQLRFWQLLRETWS